MERLSNGPLEFQRFLHNVTNFPRHSAMQAKYIARIVRLLGNEKSRNLMNL